MCAKPRFAFVTFEERREEIRALGIAGFVRERFGFDPDEVQADLLETGEKRVLVNCTRQWGKSTVMAARIAYEAFMRPDLEIVVMSITEKHAFNLVDKAVRFLKKIGVRTRGVPCYKVGRLLPNGSKILGSVAREDRARSFSPNMVVIDEAGAVPDPAYSALLPALAATGGSLFVVGTPWKQRGFFYEQWHSGEDWKRVSVKATDCSRIAPSFLEEMRRMRGDEFVQREFLCEFVGSDDRLFSRRELERMPAADVREYRGNFGMRSEEREIVVGLDLGKLRDYSAISIIERVLQPMGRDPVSMEFVCRRRNVLRHLEKVPLGTSYPRVVARVQELLRGARMAGRVTLAVDATGVGEAVVDEIRALGTGCPLVPVSITGGSRTVKEGSRWNVPRREILVGLQGMICRREFEIAGDLKLRDEFVEELLSMGRTLRAEEGSHDDLLFSVGLAAWWLRGRGFAGERGEPLAF